jgi:hypothetical protein
MSINLRTDEVDMKSDNKIGDKNIIISLAILLFIFLLYGAVFTVAKLFDSKIAEARSQYMAKYSSFTAGNANEIIDFENRSVAAKQLLASDESAILAMEQIENTIVPPIYLLSYKYEKDEKMVTLQGAADNFNTVAKQILSFKESGYFSSVTLGPSAFDKDNKLNFAVTLIRK